MTAAELGMFFVVGYIATVLIEVCVLLPGLSQSLSLKDRLTYSVLLTAFTYPFVVIVFPLLLSSHGRFATLLVAETFAPAAEVFLLRFAMAQPLQRRLDRNAIAVVVANFASFIIGEMFLSNKVLELSQSLL